MRRYWLLLLLLLTVPLSATPPLRVGMELNYPPFEMVCNDGSACGISVDIAKALGKYLGRDVEIQNISFVGLIPALKTGKVDLVISSLSITDERRCAIAFSEPYATAQLAMLVSSKSTLQNIAEADNAGRVIAVKSGTSGELYARNHLKRATVRVFDQEATCVLEVIQGKADAFLYDQLSVYTQSKRHPTTTRALLTPISTEHWSIGIRKGNTALLDSVNAFIEEFKAEGGFQHLADQYLSEQQKAFKKLGLHFIF